VGKLLLDTTDRLFQMGTSGGAMVAFVRRHVAPTLAKAVLSQPTLRRLVLGGLTQTGIHYRTSSIVGQSAHAGDVLADGPVPGDRAPDAALIADEGVATRLFREIRGTRHQLLLFQGDLPGSEVESRSRTVRDAMQSSSDLADLHVIRSPSTSHGLRDSGEAHRRYGVRAAAQYLVRPDGHVAWRGPGWDPIELIAFCRRIELRA
jgi:hypothetical protein